MIPWQVSLLCLHPPPRIINCVGSARGVNRESELVGKLFFLFFFWEGGGGTMNNI